MFGFQVEVIHECTVSSPPEKHLKSGVVIYYCLGFREAEFTLLLGFLFENVLNRDVGFLCLL